MDAGESLQRLLSPSCPGVVLCSVLFWSWIMPSYEDAGHSRETQITHGTNVVGTVGVRAESVCLCGNTALVVAQRQ